jgi:branched-chain amino acid transport system ATP-binding protein
MSLALRLKSATPVIVGMAALALAPRFVGTSTQSITTLCYILTLLLVGISLNIVMGFAGQLFLGPGAIFAVSGFACAILANKAPQVGLAGMCLIGIAFAVATSLIFAVPALRVGGFYLGMMTLYLALVVPAVAKHLEIAGNDTGISLLANLDWNQQITGYALYLTGVGLLALMLVFSYLLLHSRVGNRFIAVRDSEILASSVGIRGYTTKLSAFVLSGVPAGVAAAFYVYSQQFISPGSITPTLSIYILAACVIGGFGTNLGPVTGGAIVFGFIQYSGGVGQYQGIVLGLVLIAVSLLLPRGLPALVADNRNRFRRNSSADTPAHAGVQPISEAAIRGLIDPSDLSLRLTVSGLSRSFGPIRAVDDVSLDVESGTVHALIGANGSGKTSLLNLISGMYAPSSGVARLGDAVVTGRGPLTPVRAGIARTFQTPKLSLERTVRDNLVVAIEQVDTCHDIQSVLRLPAGRRNRLEAVARADAALHACGIGSYAGDLAGQVPHGVQRLVEVARAIAVTPRMVLLDEPAAGLSAAEMAVLKSVVRELARSGVGVLIIEHNLNVVFDVADVVTVLHQGSVIASGTPNEVRSAAAVSDAYLGAGVSGHSIVAARARGGDETVAGSTETILKVRGLHAGYGKLPVVSELNLDLRPGEILALVGRNGVGKTTTLHAIGGIRLGMNSGYVELAGEDVSSMRPERIAAAGIALVPEGRRISLTMSVEENLRLGSFIHGKQTSAAMQHRLDSVYEMFPALRDKRSELTSQLSGGQQQMVAVGQALMADPKVLLLDEPTAGLAPKLCDELYEVLHKLKEQSMAIVVVDQSLDRSLHNADRYTVMDDGKEVAAGDCHVAGSRDAISRIMLGSAEIPVPV